MDLDVKRTAYNYGHLAAQLKSQYLDIDDETLADTLQGLSDLPEMIEEIIRSTLEDEAMITGLKARAEAMASRLSRLQDRRHKKRELVTYALGVAGIPKLCACDFTVSLSEGLLRLELRDSSKVPAAYFIPQPAKLDKAAVSEALKRGETIEGASMVRGAPFITVRTQ